MKSFLTCMLLLGLACNNVRAAPTAFVTVYGLNVDLFDLNPTDTVVPQMSLELAESFGSVSQYSLPEASWPPLREDHIFVRGGANVRDGTGSATVVMLDAFKEAQAVSTGTGAFAAALSDKFTFTLTPHTRAVFGALTESTVTATSYGSAVAQAGLTGRLINVPGEPPTTFQAINVWTESGRSQLPVAAEIAAGNTSVSGEVALLGNVYATSALLVPEPGHFGDAAGRTRHRGRPTAFRPAAWCAARWRAHLPPAPTWRPGWRRPRAAWRIFGHGRLGLRIHAHAKYPGQVFGQCHDRRCPSLYRYAAGPQRGGGRTDRRDRQFSRAA